MDLPSPEATIFPATTSRDNQQQEVATGGNNNINNHNFSSGAYRRSCPPSGAVARQQQQQQHRDRRSPPADRTHQSLPHHRNFIVIPPDAVAEQPQPQVAQPKRHSRQFSDKGGNTEEGLTVTLQQRLFEHYHLVAYALVIVTYFLAFCEYLYLRLLSLVYADHAVVYLRHCDNRWLQPIQRNELHFASGCAVFLVMSSYQLCCFFLLTVSTKYMQIRRTFAHVVSIEQRLHMELVFTVKRTMFATLYPTFGIYVMCSAVILCTILYMVGLRDQINVASRVIVYVFDFCVLLYFLAFPLLCVLFHPEIDCRARLARLCCRTTRATATVHSASLQTSEDAPKAHPKLRHNLTERRGSGTVRSAPALAENTNTKSTVVAAHQQQQRSMVPDAITAVNYGSLERRRPGSAIVRDENIAEDITEATASSRRNSRRPRVRRQDRYRRLRGVDDSDEATEGEVAQNAELHDEEMQRRMHAMQVRMEDADGSVTC